MKINGNEIRPGNVIEHNGGLWAAVKTNHVKPGKGGAYNQVELKNLIDGTKLNQRFRSRRRPWKRCGWTRRISSYLYAAGRERSSSWIRKPTSSLNCKRTSSASASAFLAGRHDRDRRKLYEEKPIGISASRSGDALPIVAGRSGGEGTDGHLVLQAGGHGKRRSRDGASIRRLRRKALWSIPMKSPICAAPTEAKPRFSMTALSPVP